jgi:hypothetical protein
MNVVLKVQGAYFYAWWWFSDCDMLQPLRWFMDSGMLALVSINADFCCGR